MGKENFKYPKQGYYLNKEVLVCFNSDTSNIVLGKVIRDDIEEPGLMLIQLENGQVVKSTECCYQPI